MRSARAFLPRVRRTFLAAAAVLLVLSAWFPAPLQESANPRVVPNPVKAAWFLVWVQELVSHSNLLIYPVLGLGLAFLLLPYLPGVGPAEGASWFPRDQRGVNAATLAAALLILCLTAIAVFFRGENWSLVFGP